MKWNITTKRPSLGEKLFLFQFSDDANRMGFTLSYDLSEPKEWFIRDMFVCNMNNDGQACAHANAEILQIYNSRN